MAIEKETQQYRGTSADGWEWENRDCVIRAFCVLTGKPYAELHALAKSLGRKDKQGTSDLTIRRMANALKLVLIPYGYNLTHRRGRLVHDYPTLAQHLKKLPTLDCVAIRRGHAFAIKGGIVRDWASGTGARSRIHYYIRKELQP